MDNFISQDIRDNAAKLQAFLGYPDWLNFIGIGENNGKPCIYLYVNRKNFPRNDISASWFNMPVKVRYIGKIRPA